VPSVLESAEQTAAADAHPYGADDYRHAMSLLEARIATDEIASQLLSLERRGSNQSGSAGCPTEAGCCRDLRRAATSRPGIARQYVES
jgi:hypothetical protein